ncbi:MAG: hypothetical protein JST75_05780 [Bacteroidetes bacterium]|nr:hypothetical protein [Bacteroidota bacterium]
MTFTTGKNHLINKKSHGKSRAFLLLTYPPTGMSSLQMQTAYHGMSNLFLSAIERRMMSKEG